MKITRSYFFLFAAAVSTKLLGCAAPTSDSSGLEESAVGAAEQALGIWDPPPGKNGKRPPCFWHPATQRAYRALGAHALTSFPDIIDIPDDCRQEVLENVFECALTPTQTITDPHDGHVYGGHWGLGQGWMNAPLSTDARRWVTACMAQRLNYSGDEVDILLEGAATPIHTVPVYDQMFSFDESNAWGDLFSVAPTDHFQLEVCWSPDLQRLCSGTSGWTPNTWLTTRICDGNPQFIDAASGDPYPCGLVVRGPCASSQVCPTQSPYPVCKRSNGTLDDHPIHVQLLPRRSCTL